MEKSKNNIDSITEMGDCGNYVAGAIMVSFLEMNTFMHKYKADNSEKLITLIDKYYNNIKGERWRKLLLSQYSDAKDNYLNRDKPEDDMCLEEKIEKVKKIWHIGSNLFKEADKLSNKTDFYLELSSLIKKGKINSNSKKVIYKIFDCSVFAQQLREEYADDRIYSTVQKECLNAYNTIKEENAKELLSKYTKDFLK